MRTPGIVLLITVCFVGTGCSEFLRNSLRNITEFPIQSYDECRRKAGNERRAAEAWQLVSGAKRHPESCDYADGFQAGYADYLDNGGNGDPPAVPPFCYRTVRYENPQGVAAIEQWYAGWKQGAMMAKSSGQRELELVPLSAPPINAVERNNGDRNYGPPIALPPTKAELLPVLPKPEQLAPPREAPEALPGK